MSSQLVPKAAGMTTTPLTPEQINKLLEQFEAIVDTAVATGDAATIESARRRVAKLQSKLFGDKPLRALPPPDDPDTEEMPRLSIEVGKGVGVGNSIGTGNVSAGKIAGNNNVEANIYIDKVETLITPDGKLSASDSKVQHNYLIRLLIQANRVPLGQLELRAAGSAEDMPEIRLEQVYVPLDTTQTQPALGDDHAGTRVPISMMAAVIKDRRLVILGDPGSGKTTFTNYLTIALAQSCLDPERFPPERLSVAGGNGQRAANWKYGALLPVRIDLRELAQTIPETLSTGNCELVWNHIANHHLTLHGLGEFAPMLKKALFDGRCLVMFDGLDEVSDLTKRRIIKEAVEDFADSFGRSRFIVTCRVLSYTDAAWRLNSFPDVTLAPLSAAGIRVFIDAWYDTLARLAYTDRENAARKAAQLRRAAARLSDLAQNPMLLTVMAVVHTYLGTLPRERAKLYNDCVQLLLWNWQRHKHSNGEWQQGILHELETREERLINGLCAVAYQAHSKPQTADPRQPADIAEADVINTLRKFLDNDFGKAQRFCQYVEKEAGLLIGRGFENGERKFAFPHRGFQEFLAARHVVSGHEFSRRVKELAAQGDLWHEVLLLAVGHLVFNHEEVARPLDAINLLCPNEQPSDEAGWRAVWWSAEMLTIVGRSAAEQDEHVGRQLIPRLINQLTALVSGGHLTAIERTQAADVLGMLGDPRIGVCTVVPEMVRLEGGSFAIGHESERHTVSLKPFMLSRFPITNAQFRVFSEDGGYHKKQFWTARGWEWRERTGERRGFIDDPVWGIDNRPAAGITWHEAVAYTRWLSERTGRPMRLPTEAEWERAAAGSEPRKYPWGSRTNDDTANHRETGIGQTVAVGVFAADCTPEGIYDLGGNVWEWTSSINAGYPYAADGRESLDAAGARILRGGGYDSPRITLHCSHRRPVDPNARVPLIGFRVACEG